MSTFRNPVGPQPSNVYWRRRIIVGLGLLAVIIVILLLIFGPRGAADKTSDVTKTNTPTSPSADPSAACKAGTIQVIAATDKSSYAAGEKPKLTLTVKNNGAVACTVNAGTSQQDFAITSGSEKYWDVKDCIKDPADASVVLEPGEEKSTDPITWDGTRSSTTTCDSTARPAAPRGGASYHLNITLGDLKSNDVQFILN